jgi:hypothetical protein
MGNKVIPLEVGSVLLKEQQIFLSGMQRGQRRREQKELLGYLWRSTLTRTWQFAGQLGIDGNSDKQFI